MLPTLNIKHGKTERKNLENIYLANTSHTKAYRTILKSDK